MIFALMKLMNEILYKIAKQLQMDNEVNFKVILLGSQSVGKSSMIRRYIKGQFFEQYQVTVGVQYASKSVTIDNKTTVRLQIWDTAGQEMFRSVVRSFYRGISAVFFVYSIDSLKSFEELRDWFREVKENAHQEAVIFLIGARADLQQFRQITTEAATQFLKQIGGVFFIQTSSKSGNNVEVLFQKAAEILFKKYISNAAFRNLVKPMMASGISARSESSTRLTMQQKKKSCC